MKAAFVKCAFEPMLFEELRRGNGARGTTSLAYVERMFTCLARSLVQPGPIFSQTDS